MSAMQEPKSLGALVRLSALRRAHALTLSEVCERAAARGVDLTTSGLSRIENGSRRASPRVLRALADVFQISALDIVQADVAPTQQRAQHHREAVESAGAKS